jgi:hypothetical protein
MFISVFTPGLSLSDELPGFFDALIETLTGEHAEFDFGHIEPTAVFGGVVELETLGKSFSFGRSEGLVERTGMMGVELVVD